VYAYFVPSEFSRAIVEFLQEKTGRVVFIFVFVFLVTLVGWNVGYWEFGLVAIGLALLYALTA
jgi:hypothetical protein